MIRCVGHSLHSQLFYSLLYADVLSIADINLCVLRHDIGFCKIKDTKLFSFGVLVYYAYLYRMETKMIVYCLLWLVLVIAMARDDA